MDELPPPLPPAVRREPLLRGPLVFTAMARVLMVPFYLVCGVGSSYGLKILPGHFTDYVPLYVADKIALAGIMWSLLLLSLLLAWLFFARSRMFRGLMIYYSVLPILLFIGMAIHGVYFPRRHETRHTENPYAPWIGGGMVLTTMVWPFYYLFSPRVKRVFTR